MFYELGVLVSLTAFSIKIYKRGVIDGYKRGLKDTGEIIAPLAYELIKELKEEKES